MKVDVIRNTWVRGTPVFKKGHKLDGGKVASGRYDLDDVDARELIRLGLAKPVDEEEAKRIEAQSFSKPVVRELAAA